MHSLLPPLIDVYITSIILPSTKTDRTNEPIRDEEILAVFKDSTFLKNPGKITSTADTQTKHSGKSPPRAKDSGKGEKHGGKDSKSKKRKAGLGDSSSKLQIESEHAGMASKLLLMYYVLAYQDTYMTNIKNIGKFLLISAFQ